MKIAIVGSKDSVNKVYNIAKKNYKDYKFTPFEVSNTDDCKDILTYCEKKTDGIILTGLGFVKIINQLNGLSKPYELISRDGTSIMKAFWNIKNLDATPRNIAIDVVDKNLVNDICNEINIQFNKIFEYPHKAHKKETVYKEEYVELWNEDKIDLVITGYGWIYEELKKQNINVLRLEITNPLIRNSIESLINKIQKNNIKKSQIAIQLVDISLKNDSDRYQYNILKKIVFVESKLIDYISLLQGTMFRSGHNQFKIISTRGAIENDIAQKKFLNILKKLKSKKIKVHSGVGFGNTEFEADFNSRIALDKAKNFHEYTFYIVDDEKNIFGPIGNKETLHYKSLITDNTINDISKQIGISTTYLSKIHYLMENTNTEYLNSKNLAELLNITKRSARRILNKLKEAGYAEIVSSTQTKSVGRPTNIFKVNIPL